MDKLYHFPFQKKNMFAIVKAFPGGGTSDKWSFATLFG